MYVLTNAQMRNADQYTIQTLGTPSLTLMERAGAALADKAENLLPRGKIVCLCGGGNNGGDGFVCARILAVRGRDVSVVCYAEKFSQDCEINKARWLETGEIVTELPYGDLFIDCLYGTGFHGVLQGKDEEIVKELGARKAKGAKVLSADVPSGICGENGIALGAAVQADATLCIGEYKLGVLLGDGIDHAGKIDRADIGIRLLGDVYVCLSDGETVKERLPKRRRNSHKGSYGKAAILAGSAEFTGAAYLAAAACLRSGVGYTTLFLPKEILPSYMLKAPEVLLKSINEGDRYAFNEKNLQELLEYDSIAVGMGMGVSKDVALCVEYLIAQYAGKLLIDADGLNSLAAYASQPLSALFANKKCDVLLTPHVKEFSRLCGESVADIQTSGLEAPVRFAKDCKVNVLLKSAVSVLTDGERTYLNASGNSGLAKGGSGDVLSGLIAGLCASGASVFDGALAGAFLAGKAAEIGASEKGVYALTATDVIEKLGAAFLSL